MLYKDTKEDANVYLVVSERLVDSHKFLSQKKVKIYWGKIKYKKFQLKKLLNELIDPVG